LIDRYREVGLLDDAELAATIVRTRHAERGQAPRAIRAELHRKGFEAPDIDAALEQITDEGIEDRARDLAAKRWSSLGGVEEPARTRRVAAMLGRKGYSPALAFAVVKDLQRADKAGVD
jgi:regulatory protein